MVGNYGSAWQMQKLEFAMFPGPILMTTNCIIEPRKSYKVLNQLLPLIITSNFLTTFTVKSTYNNYRLLKYNN